MFKRNIVILFSKKTNSEGKRYRDWVWPLPSNSDHQDYYIFSRTIICHCYWEGATPNIETPRDRSSICLTFQLKYVWTLWSFEWSIQARGSFQVTPEKRSTQNHWEKYKSDWWKVLILISIIVPNSIDVFNTNWWKSLDHDEGTILELPNLDDAFKDSVFFNFTYGNDPNLTIVLFLWVAKKTPKR